VRAPLFFHSPNGEGLLGTDFVIASAVVITSAMAAATTTQLHSKSFPDCFPAAQSLLGHGLLFSTLRKSL